MRVFSKSRLRDFWEQHPDAQAALDDWYRTARRAHWSNPADIRSRYANASFVGRDRVVFNIRGNTYRLVVQVDYVRERVHIRFVGTHAQYDRINAGEV